MRFLKHEEIDRPPFIPLVCSFAAKVQQISVKEMLNNPTKLANSLQKTQQLIGYDGIINIFDPSLEAEACGCQISWVREDGLPKVISHPLERKGMIDLFDDSRIMISGRIPVVLEATRRLKMTMGNKVGIIGVITGPLQLAKQLKGNSFKKMLIEDRSETEKILKLVTKIIVNMCRSYGEENVDVTLVADEIPPEVNSGVFSLIRSIFQTLYNTVKYYDSHLIILIKHAALTTVENLFSLKSDGIAVNDYISIEELRDIAHKKRSLFGKNIPMSAITGSLENLKRELVKSLEKGGKKGFFISTQWEIPFFLPVQNMHYIVRTIRREGSS